MKKEFDRGAEEAEMRLTNILVRHNGMDVDYHIDLRTRRMINREKLFVWANLLKKKKYFHLAKRARQRLNCIA